jgi:hypothetical protein
MSQATPNGNHGIDEMTALMDVLVRKAIEERAVTGPNYCDSCHAPFTCGYSVFEIVDINATGAFKRGFAGVCLDPKCKFKANNMADWFVNGKHPDGRSIYDGNPMVREKVDLYPFAITRSIVMFKRNPVSGYYPDHSEPPVSREIRDVYLGGAICVACGKLPQCGVGPSCGTCFRAATNSGCGWTDRNARVTYFENLLEESEWGTPDARRKVAESWVE